MSLDVAVAAENVRLSVSRARIERLARDVLRAERVRDAVVSITFMDDAAIARMNRRHLGHRGPTDVISFGFLRASPAAPVTGDIYIGLDVARRNAADAGVGVRDEVQRLVVHGILHVLGYDHPEGDERLRSPMWRRQERLVDRLVRTRRP